MITPILLKDGYKVDHRRQYPAGTEYVYSNLTPRKSRTELDGVIFFGMQYFIREYLQRQFSENFFNRPSAVDEYKRIIDAYLGPGAVTYDHIEALHKLGYLPLQIKAVKEGTFVPSNVPVLTIVNTKPEFFWLTNMMETLLSCVLWKMSTSASTAFQYRQRFQEFAQKTSDSEFLVPWQGHDFSMRGMSGPEDAAMSGAAHLLSFTGTDSIPAIHFLEQYYGANVTKELVGGSVPATEHSVMCMGGDDGELATFERILDTYPTGIVSVVSDTWDYWNVLENVLPKLKDKIMARDGKLVIRPDSGDPFKIICGHPDYPSSRYAEQIGTVRSLFDTFGGIKNSKGYIELDSHVGCIYGDSITLDKQRQILEGLANDGFASTNIVLGIGSFTYQYVTRDTYGFAMKATHGVINGRPIEIYKDPATDRAVGGSKKSHRGLLQVYVTSDGKLAVKQQCTTFEETQGELKPVFINGSLVNPVSLSEIRARVETQLNR